MSEECSWQLYSIFLPGSGLDNILAVQRESLKYGKNKRAHRKHKQATLCGLTSEGSSSQDHLDLEKILNWLQAFTLSSTSAKGTPRILLPPAIHWLLDTIQLPSIHNTQFTTSPLSPLDPPWPPCQSFPYSSFILHCPYTHFHLFLSSCSRHAWRSDSLFLIHQALYTQMGSILHSPLRIHFYSNDAALA